MKSQLGGPAGCVMETVYTVYHLHLTIPSNIASRVNKQMRIEKAVHALSSKHSASPPLAHMVLWRKYHMQSHGD